jgi:predicted dehydrogenase
VVLLSDRLGFAVVGSGWFGAKRIAALQRIEDASLEWVVDVDRERAESAARAASCRHTTRLGDAVRDSKVDCVVVCTPNKMHPEAVVQALRHGKHVLCEKPLARNVEEAESMVKVAKRCSAFLKTGSNHRYFPNVMKATELVKTGKIGRPIFFRGSIGHDGELLKGRWFWDKDMAGGGTFLDNGCHLLDLARELLGDFSECVGTVSTSFWPVSPLEDNGFALYRSPSGLTALVQSSWVEWYGYMYFEVYGDEGFVIVDSRRSNRTLYGRRGEEHTTLYDYTDIPPRSHELELRAFIESVRRGEQPRPSGEDGLRVIQMVDALYRSSTSGMRVTF